MVCIISKKEKNTILNLNQIQLLIIEALEDVKGQNIKIFDSSDKSNFFDRVVIATGISTRQTKALARSVVEKVKQNSGFVYGVEGIENGEWVLIDCGDIICHVMHPEIREYYSLEEIWGAKPIKN